MQDVTNIAKNWKRSIRLQGGFWQGSFEIEADTPVLQDWFYNRLGYHVVESTAAGNTWEGMVYEMQLSLNGATLRRSLSTMWNRVEVCNTSSWADTPWYTYDNTQSQARYGIRHMRKVSPSDVGNAGAQQWGQRLLKENAYPYARPMGIALGSTSKNRLQVTVCGYVFTLNWRIDESGNRTASDVLTTVLGRSSQFITAGNIQTNSTTGWFGGRVWDMFKSLTGGSDSTLATWTLTVGANRQLHYKQLSLSTPNYVILHGKLFNNPGGEISSPYAVRPGVIRDQENLVTRGEDGSLFTDARDTLVDEVEVQANGRLNFKTPYSSVEESAAEMARTRGGTGPEGETDWTIAAHQDDQQWRDSHHQNDKGEWVPN